MNTSLQSYNMSGNAETRSKLEGDENSQSSEKNQLEESTEEHSENKSEEQDNQENEREPYNPKPKLGDLSVAVLICVVLVPIWASPLTGLIALGVSSVSSIDFIVLTAILSAISAVVFFAQLYSHNYR